MALARWLSSCAQQPGTQLRRGGLLHSGSCPCPVRPATAVAKRLHLCKPLQASRRQGRMWSVGVREQRRRRVAGLQCGCLPLSALRSALPPSPSPPGPPVPPTEPLSVQCLLMSPAAAAVRTAGGRPRLRAQGPARQGSRLRRWGCSGRRVWHGASLVLRHHTCNEARGSLQGSRL
jgi:hypothetical protein